MATLLITGATSGLGEALTLESVAQGHRVIACGRNQEKLSQLNQSSSITTIEFDTTNAEQTKNALANVKCDIAVLNAGTCEYVDILKIETSLFRRVFDVNFFGTINVVSALLPSLERGNKLVFVDSMARLMPFTRSEAYGASKAAVHYACKSFDVDLNSRGIKVQSVSPGFVKTPLTDKNDFPMPMAITAEQAAKYMLKGIQSNKSNVYFPRRFGAIMRFLNFLPEGLQRRICLKMLDSSQSSSSDNNNKDRQAYE